MSTIKLSEPQRKLLLEICLKPKHTVSYYAPGQKLIKHGLACYTSGAGEVLAPTTAGRQMAAQLQGTLHEEEGETD